VSGHPDARAIFAEAAERCREEQEALYRAMLVALLREPQERRLAWADLQNIAVLEGLLRMQNSAWRRALEALAWDVAHGYDPLADSAR
jgi:hypothetical protein